MQEDRIVERLEPLATAEAMTALSTLVSDKAEVIEKSVRRTVKLTVIIVGLLLAVLMAVFFFILMGRVDGTAEPLFKAVNRINNVTAAAEHIMNGNGGAKAEKTEETKVEETKTEAEESIEDEGEEIEKTEEPKVKAEEKAKDEESEVKVKAKVEKAAESIVVDPLDVFRKK